MSNVRPFLLLILLLVGHARPAHAQKPYPAVTAPTVTWDFDIKHDKQTNPHGAVYLRVGAKRIFITKTSSEFQVVPRSDYKDHKIPADAVTACAGWWAGQGQDLYVVRRGQYLDVYLRGLDEQAEIPPYKRLKRIPLR